MSCLTRRGQRGLHARRAREAMARADVGRQQLAAVLEHESTQHGALRQRQPLPRLFEDRVLFAEQACQREVQIFQTCRSSFTAALTSSQVSCARRWTS